MTATRNAVLFGSGARGAKLAALGLGVALFASACGGSGTPEQEGGTSAPAASGLTCPEPGENGAGAERTKGDPSAVPASKGSTEQPLKIGTLLPTTGTLAYLGPPEIAGSNLAIKEINEAGGVLGKDVEIVHRDSGDTTTDIATQSVSDLLGQDVSAIVGAASSSVSFNVIDQITNAGVVQFSPANTSPEFSDYDDNGLYFRTAPSDVLQGRTLGSYMISCGAQTLGMIVLNDPYGTGLQKNVKEAFEGAGGQVVAEEMFNTGDSQFSSQVDAVVAADPDAIAVITFDEIKSIAPLLLAKGVSPEQLFLVDGNTADLSEDLDPGAMEGAQGTIPGTFAKDEFRSDLATVDDSLTDYAYAGEAYDAVNMIALAAEAAGSTTGEDIAAELVAVSKDGEKCYDFAGCVTLLREGQDIDYDGLSGPVTFDENGDPTEAYIGIYNYDAENVPQPAREEFGQL
ncbi:branched-chain amino acid ABC transporter BraC [Arthrobacter crystallopoietes BAB-32]|uniref:Branched-chain amino acid ABC transporter BraC n=1 Tax=Arthrobacter crystallopoietes BAB-32 TaxID=1246476 RepID=N1V3X7_9MICC|nr:ABC transporter substrate-binding protein [Arthrobacter crystallopoietes]EMY32953.1 branched-chain amino acid ABC transporter BraC [Arthrobacter crystallopoietes BAB-32]